MPPKSPPTHFLCIPLQAPQLARSLTSFKTDITSPDSFAIPEAAVRPFGTLHLTLGVLNLRDESSLHRAVDLLKGLRLKSILDRVTLELASGNDKAKQMGLPTPNMDEKLSVTLQGLHAMQKPSATSVLYTPPIDSTGLLRSFCEAVRGEFLRAELMTDEGRPLLLHATVVNTIYVKGRGKKRQTIDARGVLDRYEDYVWLEGLGVDGVRMCRMGAKNVGGEGEQEYEVEAEVGFENQ